MDRSFDVGPVIALGLDSMNADLLDAWMDAGDLPISRACAARMRAVRPTVRPPHRKQLAPPFLHGCPPEISGEWGFQDYDPANHRTVIRSSYAFRNYAGFHALAAGKRVIAFDFHYGDVVDGEGLQVFGWGRGERGDVPLGASRAEWRNWSTAMGITGCSRDVTSMAAGFCGATGCRACTMPTPSGLRDHLVEGSKAPHRHHPDLMRRGL